MSNWPKVTLRAAFGSVWTDASPSWTTLPSTTLQGFTYTRGRDRSLDQVQAGTARFVLDNRDRRYEPGYASSPYYDDLKFGVPINLRAVWSGTTYDLWFGYVTAWRQVYAEGGKVSECHVDAADVFNLLANYALSKYPTLVTGTTGLVSYWRLQETSGSTAVDSASTEAGMHNDGVYVGSPTLGSSGPLAGDNYSVTFGSTRYVDVGAPSTGAPFDATGDWTWMAWLRLSS